MVSWDLENFHPKLAKCTKAHVWVVITLQFGGSSTSYFGSSTFLPSLAEDGNSSPTHCTSPRCWAREHATFNSHQLLCENLALPGGQISVFPVRKMFPIEVIGACLHCKFHGDKPKGWGDMTPWILAEKRKWNHLWEYPKSINVQSGPEGHPITHKKFRLVGLYSTPFGSSEWFLKIQNLHHVWDHPWGL